MVVDVEGFGDPARTNLDQLAVREALYEALARAFAESGIGWGSCVSEDRGDGALILIPPEVPKSRLVTGLPGMLAAAVTRHNTGSSAPERMRLRVALHAGEVYHDAHGVAGRRGQSRVPAGRGTGSCGQRWPRRPVCSR